MRQTLPYIISLCLPFAIFFFALGFFCVSTLDYSVIIDFLSRLVINANPKTYLTPTVFTEISVKLRYFSLVLMLLCIGLFSVRKKIEKSLKILAQDSLDLVRDLKTSMTAYFTKQTRLEYYLEIGFVLIMMIIGFFLRYHYLLQPIRNDEAYVFEALAKQPLFVLVSTYNNVGNHIFHTVLTHISWMLFGDSLIALRLPVFLAGILLIPVAYLAVRKLYDKTSAMMSMALIASSSALIEYSVNNRGYEILTLIIACLLLLASYLLKNANRVVWVLWSVLVALGFWTLPTMYYVYGGIALWFLTSLFLDKDPINKDRGVNSNINKILILKHFLAANVFAALLTLLFYSPVLIVFGLGHMREMMSGAQESANYNMFASLMNSVISVKNVWLRNVPMGLTVILGVFALIGSVFQGRISNNRINLFVSSIMWLMLSSLIMPLYALYTGFTRLWTAHSLFFYITIGIGFSVVLDLIIRILARFNHDLVVKNPLQKPATWFSLTIAIVLSLLFGYQEINHQFVGNILQDSFHDAKPVAQFLKEYLKEGDCIYDVCPYGAPLKYEMSRLNTPLNIVKAKLSSGKELHFSSLAKIQSKNNVMSDNLNHPSAPAKKRLIIISVPQYKGFVPSNTVFDELVLGENLEKWQQYQLKKIKSFSRTDLYEINLDKLQESMLVFK